MKHIITLQHPVEYNGETVAELQLRRPKGRDLEQMEAGKEGAVTRSFRMLASLAERPVDLIRELDPVDIETINDWLAPILDPKGRASVLGASN